MPQPSPEHAPIMRKMADEILAVYPTASVFEWAMSSYQGWHASIGFLLDKEGERLEDSTPDSPERAIVQRYEEALGWTDREDGNGFVFSVIDAIEIADIEGTGTIDEPYRDHPGLEFFSY